MFYRKNSVILGLIVGLVVPFVTYALLLTVLETIDTYAGFTQVQLSAALKPRTLVLIALCCNILTMQYYRRLRADETMRGIFISVGIGAIIWIIRYSAEIFEKI